MEEIKVFKKVNDKVVFTKRPRYVNTNKKADYSNVKSLKHINDELSNMKWEIEESATSGGNLIFKDNSYEVSHRTKKISTFPQYMRDAGISSKKDFMKVSKMKKGIRLERLRKVAIDRLNHGYENAHGYDSPDMKFKVASKQLYDNKDVIFRRVRGRIVPIRVKKGMRNDLLTQKDIDSVPF